MRHVLLVEDDPIVTQAYSRVLNTSGLELEVARDGIEALDKVCHGGFDAVLSDINMPRMSGIDFLKKIREMNLEVPVVLITGSPALETAVRAVEYGAFRYLAKPVDIDVLREAMQRASLLGEMARVKKEAAKIREAEREAHDCGELAELFDRALDQLWMAFQPIISWKARKIFGFEALVRTDEDTLINPSKLIEAAERLNRLNDLGRRIRAKVAEAAASAPPETLLFVNLHPEDLEDPELHAAEAPLAKVASRVVLEVTERASLEKVARLPERIEGLRQLGYRLAVDDLGAGYAGLSSFAVIEPDVVKLDMSLVRDVDRSPKKLSVVRSMVRLSEELGMRVVSEGIETAGERDAMVALGCDLFQGYLFARPSRGIVPGSVRF